MLQEHPVRYSQQLYRTWRHQLLVVSAIILSRQSARPLGIHHTILLPFAMFCIYRVASLRVASFSFVRCRNNSEIQYQRISSSRDHAVCVADDSIRRGWSTGWSVGRLACRAFSFGFSPVPATWRYRRTTQTELDRIVFGVGRSVQWGVGRSRAADFVAGSLDDGRTN